MNNMAVNDSFKILESEFHAELIAIGDWWEKNSIDLKNGGFYGEISEDHQINEGANKGVVLNTRILWFFSEISIQLKEDKYIDCAKYAYKYLIDKFYDKEFGGLFWELDSLGRPVNTKKQIYAQAFAIYAFTAYYRLTGDQSALSYALACFELMERYGIDRSNGGYIEAFSRDWNSLDDIRLSEKDLNYPKSQNTHLHILEAYTALYEIHKKENVKCALAYNIEIFDQYLIDRGSLHLRMFMDMEWNDNSPGYTYGHDIEATWLISKAINVLGNEKYLTGLQPLLIEIVDTVIEEGISDEGYVIELYDFLTKTKSHDAVWWVQAEALVGFLYAHNFTGDYRYFNLAKSIWEFIKKCQIDNVNGEWFWNAKIDGRGIIKNKLDMWKCPYHNGRAMLESLNFMRAMINNRY